MTRTQLADGMLYLPLHRAPVPVDSGHACASHVARHRAES